MKDDKYYDMIQLIGSHFHEDFDLYGDTLEEIVASYKRRSTAALRSAVIAQIEAFEADNRGNLEGEYLRIFGHQADPRMFEHTTASFLDELKRLLRE